MAIRKAEKQQAKLRLALAGPTGSGKTYSGLAIASAIAAATGGKIGVIDTERNSACLYSDKFTFDVEPDMQTFSPGAYVEKINEFARLGYEVLVIDSLSHAWIGHGGALEMVDNAARRSQQGRGNSFAAWRDVTPEHNKMVEAILAYPGHVIVTMRSKMEYVLEEVNGKKVPNKIGMAPIQRDGLEYEFTVVGDMDLNHHLIVTKSRCSELAGKDFKNPGKEVADILLKWLNDGATPSAQQTISSDPDADEQFKIQLAEAFQARDFTVEESDAATAAVLSKKHVANLEQLSTADRNAFINALNQGQLDKFKSQSLVGAGK